MQEASELSTEQLKVFAYDQLALREQAQHNIDVVQQELNRRQQAEKPKESEAEPEKEKKSNGKA